MILLAAIGLFFLITGSFNILNIGLYKLEKTSIHTDPLFVRLAGLLMLIAAAIYKFTEQGPTLFVFILLLSVACVIVAMIRGVTR
jgi:hypothetical protein